MWKQRQTMQSRSDFAQAIVTGSSAYPGLHGRVYFRQRSQGVLVTAEVHGLPAQTEQGNGIFGFHLHEGTSCTGNEKDPFADAKTHYNPKKRPHPYHAGDMPPLFGNNGYAYLSFYTNRFSLKEIIGKTIIIHDHPDDFYSQPSGNSGNKIACGTIVQG